MAGTLFLLFSAHPLLFERKIYQVSCFFVGKEFIG